MQGETLSSPANPRIKALAALRRKGASADDSRILIDGIREIDRARRAGLAISELYYCPPCMDSGEPAALVEACRAGGIETIEVSEPVFERIRYGDRTGGLVAVAPRPRRTLADLKLSENPLIAVVERVGKPGNLGAIVRSADAAGIEAVFVVDSAIDVYGPNVIRASVAAVFHLPLIELPAAEAIDFCRSRGLQIVAATPDARTDYTQCDYRSPTAFVFGAEDAGLSDAWRGAAVRLARVPMLGLGDSLNVSITAALFFYEARRQRGAGG